MVKAILTIFTQANRKEIVEEVALKIEEGTGGHRMKVDMKLEQATESKRQN